MNTEIPYGYIYRITNKTNGKTYIGAHKLKKEPWRKYMGSGQSLPNAYKKHGKENFVKSFVEYCFTVEELIAREVEIIHEEWKAGRGQYNKTDVKGSGGYYWDRLSPEQVEDIKRRTDIARKNNPNYGKLTAELQRERLEAEYIVFKQQNVKDILKMYAEEKSFSRVAKHYGKARHTIKRILLEEGVDLNYRTKAGYTHDEAMKKKISNGVRLANLSSSEIEKSQSVTFIDLYVKHVCQNCGKNFYTKNKEALNRKVCSKRCIRREVKTDYPHLPTRDLLHQLYTVEKKSTTQIAKILDCSQPNVLHYLKKYNIPRRSRRGADYVGLSKVETVQESSL